MDGHMMFRLSPVVTLLTLGISTTAGASDVGCGPPIDRLDEILARTRTIVLGEIHGTREIPETIVRVACQIASKGLPATVALEMPASEQPRLHSFFAFHDIPPAVLATGGYWDNGRNDGRKSQALLDALVRLRELARLGRQLRVVAVDEASFDPLPGTRDQRMAMRLLQLRRLAPDEVFVVLIGSNHARRDTGLPMDPGFEPMVHALAKVEPSLLTFAFSFTEGTAWNCIGRPPEGCAEHVVAGGDAPGFGFALVPWGDPIRYDGLLGLGSVHASFPVCPLR